MTTPLDIPPYDVNDFEFEPFVHEFRWHPIGVAEQVAGTTNNGSASCSCGGWTIHVLDNRAGRQDAGEDYRTHVNAERRARITQIAKMLLDLDLTQHRLDIQDSLAKAVNAIAQANCF